MPTKVRAFIVHLTPEARESFLRYHASVNPYGSPNDTLREIIAAQLAADPEGALHRAVRETAYRETLRAATEAARIALQQLRDHFDTIAPEG